MASRIPYHQKGKGLERGFSPPPRKRIRAPDLDTSDLIAENFLTLIGRLTNPSEQRLWSLYPFLSNRWNLKGKALGSDLGRGCFQFRFDCEEDLHKVLENRPYHFDQWIVILQKWEPIIYDSFPSMIPFWIEIQGLPKHIWKPEMLKIIGEELGEMLDMEITNSTAKIRVLLDGLQPLIKETIVDFPDGNEALVLLDYKNLKNHCLHCHRLTHDKKHCPGWLSLKEGETKLQPAHSTSHSETKGVSRNYYTPQDNFIAPRNLPHGPNSNDQRFKDHNPRKRSHDFERRAIPHLEDRSSSQGGFDHRHAWNKITEHHQRTSSRERSNSLQTRRDLGFVLILISYT